MGAVIPQAQRRVNPWQGNMPRAQGGYNLGRINPAALNPAAATGSAMYQAGVRAQQVVAQSMQAVSQVGDRVAKFGIDLMDTVQTSRATTAATQTSIELAKAREDILNDQALLALQDPDALKDPVRLQAALAAVEGAESRYADTAAEIVERNGGSLWGTYGARYDNHTAAAVAQNYATLRTAIRDESRKISTASIMSAQDEALRSRMLKARENRGAEDKGLVDRIDREVAAHRIDPIVGQKMKAAYWEQAHTNDAVELIGKNPRQALEWLQDPKQTAAHFPYLPADNRLKYAVVAQKRLEQMEADRAKGALDAAHAALYNRYSYKSVRPDGTETIVHDWDAMAKATRDPAMLRRLGVSGKDGATMRGWFRQAEADEEDARDDALKAREKEQTNQFWSLARAGRTADAKRYMGQMDAVPQETLDQWDQVLEKRTYETDPAKKNKIMADIYADRYTDANQITRQIGPGLSSEDGGALADRWTSYQKRKLELAGGPALNQMNLAVQRFQSEFKDNPTVLRQQGQFVASLAAAIEQYNHDNPKAKIDVFSAVVGDLAQSLLQETAKGAMWGTGEPYLFQVREAERRSGQQRQRVLIDPSGWVREDPDLPGVPVPRLNLIHEQLRERGFTSRDATARDKLLAWASLDEDEGGLGRDTFNRLYAQFGAVGVEPEAADLRVVASLELSPERFTKLAGYLRDNGKAVTGTAIRVVWERAGDKIDGYAPRSQPTRGRYVVGRPVGMVEQGNIDLDALPVVQNPDGSVSTVRSITVEMGGAVYLIPTIVNGRAVSPDQAVNHFRRTGRHLGAFRTVADADRYAAQAHDQMGPRGTGGAGW